jgi:uncharacterized glyoxalase superfamily protein PhnB
MKWLVPNLMVTDVAQTIAFYRDVLGFEVFGKFPEAGTPFWAMLKRGAAELMVQEKQNMTGEFALGAIPGLGGSFGLYMSVPDFEAFYESVKNQVTIVEQPHLTFYGAQRFAIRDCNGYLLVFQNK